MEELLLTVVAALLGGLLGGGGVARLLISALENKMRDTFATTAALDGHGTRLGRMEDSLHAASDAATAAHAKALEIERRQDDRWAHINQRWDETADRFERAVDRMESYLERITRLEERVNHSRVA